MDSKRKAPKVAGHKRANVSYGVSVTCECGWGSATHYGKGASGQAHAEWRGHVEKAAHAKEAP